MKKPKCKRRFNLNLIFLFLLLIGFSKLFAQQTKSQLQKKALKAINTRYIEAEPKISANGEILYFTRRNDIRNKGGKNDMGDIWFSKLLADSTWSEAENMGKPINNQAFNQVIALYAGGKIMLISGEYQKNYHSDIYITAKSYLGWTSPQIIPFENLDFENNDATYSATSDLKVLIFSMKNFTNGYGKNDLYISFKTSENTWSEPQNLGNTINTKEDELYPVIAHDNKTLYFSSKGFDGYGDYDIFMSTRLDTSWYNWSKPVNMGNQVNTAGYDADFTFDASNNCAFISSDVESAEDFDIYRIILPEENRPSPVSLLRISFSNLLNDTSIKYTLCCNLLESNKLVISENNLMQASEIILPNGENYLIKIEAPDFLPFTDTIYLKNKINHHKIELNYHLLPPQISFLLSETISESGIPAVSSPIELNDSLLKGLSFKISKINQPFTSIFPFKTISKNNPLNVMIQNINFEIGSTGLNSNEKKILELLAQELAKYPQLSIEITGHTDNTGNAEINMKLSEERAKEVASFLINQGIAQSRITYKGSGQNEPLMPNNSEENRKQNRRVEFKISLN